MRAAIYPRLSQNRDGTKESATRQETDLRKWCKREGYTDVDPYPDDGESAYRGKPPPEFQRMLANIARYDVLVFWKVDRIARRMNQFWRVIEACEKHGVRLVSLSEQIDTSTPTGKAIAMFLAAQAEQECLNISTRVKRAQVTNAQAGKPHGGRRGFGYTSDGRDIIETEADAIREARDRILRGESLNTLAYDWNARGIKPTSADAWSVTALKSMIRGPRIAGLRQHQGEVIGEGDWPAIISPDEREQILSMLNATARPRSGRPALYLLTGLAVCGRCGGTLRSTQKGRTKRTRAWACVRRPGTEQNCGRLSIRADVVDELIEELALRKLETLTIRQPTPNKVGYRDLLRVEQQITQLGLDMDEGLVSRKEWLARRTPLAEKVIALQAKRDAAAETNGLAQFANVNVRDRWAAITLAEKRLVMRLLLDRVTVQPGQLGVRTVDLDRIQPQWRKAAAR